MTTVKQVLIALVGILLIIGMAMLWYMPIYTVNATIMVPIPQK